VEKKRGKVSFDSLKFYLGDSSSRTGGMKVTSQVDLVPSSENKLKKKNVAQGSLSEAQFEICRETARKVLIALP